MKRILALAVVLFAFAILAHAETGVLPPNVPTNVIASLPPDAQTLVSAFPQWANYIVAAVVALGCLGRIWHSVTTGGGLMGIYNALYKGSSPTITAGTQTPTVAPPSPPLVAPLTRLPPIPPISSAGLPQAAPPVGSLVGTIQPASTVVQPPKS